MFGLFGKKKKTVVQTLEELEKEIKEFEKYKQKNELDERKYIGALVLYSIVLYVLGALVYYIYLMPKNVVDRVKTLIPFLITPLLIYFIRRFLKWFFIKRSTHYERKLFDLKEQKKQILEDVKEKETYKKAREILERFSANIDITPPDTPVRGQGPNNTTIMNPTSPYLNQSVMPNGGRMPAPPVPVTNLVQRNVKHHQNGNGVNPQSLSRSVLDATTMQTKSDPRLDNSVMTTNGSVTTSANGVANQTIIQKETVIVAPPSSLAAANAQARTLLPRPIVNPNRTYFDKLLDFIVGEGPNNRYALICKNCHFHNGMALKEEFEYVAFRCAYCLFYNEARKTKLSVPKLPSSSSHNHNGSAIGSSNSDTSVINNSRPRRQSNRALTEAAMGSRNSIAIEPRSESTGNRGRAVAAAANNAVANESLHSTLSSSASLDDLATVSEPIIATSSSSSAIPNGATNRRHPANHNNGSDNQLNAAKTSERSISISKESGEEEKKNI